MDQQKQNGALVIAASLIAAVRLRGEKIERTPKVIHAISECVQLARMIMQAVERNG